MTIHLSAPTDTQRAGRRHAVRVALAITFCVLNGSSVPRAVAFNSNEHTALGVYGLYWAKAIFDEENPNSPARPQVDKIVHEFLDPTADNLATYGDMVAVVDFIDSPEDCLEQGLLLGTQGNDPTEKLYNLHNKSRKLVIKRLHSLLALAGSSHNNDKHFEDRALNEFLVYHARALEFAVTKKDLWSALWIEAYADHFLQDSFAPGHIGTPRNRHLVDVASLSLHDRFNREGLYFTVNPGFLPFEKLRRAREMLLGDDINLALKAKKSLDSPEQLELTSTDVDNLLQNSAIATIPMYGDGNLKTFPKGSTLSPKPVGPDLEMPFISAVTAVAVLDILQAYSNGEAKTSFPSTEFKWYSHFASKDYDEYVQYVDLLTPVGHYQIGEDPSAPGYKENPVNLNFDKIVAFEVNYQSLLAANSGSDRIELVGETLVGGHLTENQNVFLNQTGVLLGYSYLKSRDSWGQGPTLKVVLPLPEIDMQVYALGGYRWYFRSDGHGSRPYGGLGIETGFGLLFFRLNLTEDNYLKGPIIKQSPALTFGLGFTNTINRLMSPITSRLGQNR